ncbi:hypothetical protein KY345_05860 [Candidatus Woesearchaeota archaeon]|nr:hypothetical protein [Candidatus Woesearchaeota archaeon]
MAYSDEVEEKIPNFLKNKEEYKVLIRMIKENDIENKESLTKFIDEQIEESQSSLKEEKQTTATIGSVNTMRREFALKLDTLNFIKNELLNFL